VQVKGKAISPSAEDSKAGGYSSRYKKKQGTSQGTEREAVKSRAEIVVLIRLLRSQSGWLDILVGFNLISFIVKTFYDPVLRILVWFGCLSYNVSLGFLSMQAPHKIYHPHWFNISSFSVKKLVKNVH
jgi:hypothetical protein